jgi:uncharacterized protein YdhG (YjbR/CyaY superfamily)
MAETKSSKKTSGQVWSAEEKAAMREVAKERKKAAGKADGEKDVLDKIAEMSDSDRAMAERIHAIVKEVAPELEPRTWYGMPAYAKDSKVICFFTAAGKFKERYASFGVQPAANLDEGNMWPTSWALTKVTDAEATSLAELIKRAVT